MIKLNQTEEMSVLVFQYVLVLLSLAASGGFIALLTKLEGLQKSMEFIQTRSLKKYKYMFNAIQESIIALKDDQVSFLNS